LVVVTTVLGAFISIQARINGELGHRLQDGYFAAVISFGSGLVVLTIVVVISRPGRRARSALFTALRTRAIPWWYFIGGACGAMLVLSQGVSATLLGVALFTVAMVAGQTLSALVVDRRGIGTMPPKSITWPRAVGTFLMVAAVVCAVSGDLTGTSSWTLMLMPFTAGLLVSFQQAINGQVKQKTSSALIATWNNFGVGTVVLVIIFVVHGLSTHWPTQLPTAPWLYAGGLMGIVFIAGTAILVKHIGVLILGLCSIAGQLIGSLLLDLVAPTPGHGLSWTTVAGTGLALLAIAVTALPARRRGP